MNQLGKDLSIAADGASQLAHGSGELRTGVVQLAEGSPSLSME